MKTLPAPKTVKTLASPALPDLTSALVQPFETIMTPTASFAATPASSITRSKGPKDWGGSANKPQLATLLSTGLFFWFIFMFLQIFLRA